jgi:hypothetical protein
MSDHKDCYACRFGVSPEGSATYHPDGHCVRVWETSRGSVDKGWLYQIPSLPAPLAALRAHGPYPNADSAFNAACKQIREAAQ